MVTAMKQLIMRNHTWRIRDRSEFIEKEPLDLKPGIKIMNLVKEFRTDSGTS